MKLPTLPPGAAYLRLAPDPAKGNVLSRHVLRDLNSQLTAHLQHPESDSASDVIAPAGPTHVLPPLKPQYLAKLEQAIENPSSPDAATARFAWLVHAPAWRRFRTSSRPKVLVLRPETPGIFASRHDIHHFGELTQDTKSRYAPPPSSPSSTAARRELVSFMNYLSGITMLIRHSPIPIVAPIEGLVAGIGCELVLSADHPIAMADTPFQIPGHSHHPDQNHRLSRTSSTIAAIALTRLGVPQPLAYRMMALGEPVTADQLGGNVVDAVPVPTHAESTDTRARALEARVDEVVRRLVSVSGQAHALGKWALLTAAEMRLREGSVDGDEGVVEWMARVAALQARVEEEAARNE